MFVFLDPQFLYIISWKFAIKREPTADSMSPSHAFCQPISALTTLMTSPWGLNQPLPEP
jgi:hypothetical protein